MSRYERRRPELYKLRVYIDAVKDAKATTDAEWMDRWVASATPDTDWVSRAEFIAYLEACALLEAERTLRLAA